MQVGEPQESLGADQAQHRRPESECTSRSVYSRVKDSPDIFIYIYQVNPGCTVVRQPHHRPRRCWRRIITDDLYTKGTRAHTHRELIGEWLWDLFIYLYICIYVYIYRSKPGLNVVRRLHHRLSRHRRREIPSIYLSIYFSLYIYLSLSLSLSLYIYIK